MNIKMYFKMMLAVVILATALVACNKDNDKNGNGGGGGGGGINSDPSIVEAKSVEGDCSKVKSVKMVVEFFDEDVVIASGEFKNGGFKLQLPKTISDSDLMLATDWFENNVVSDKNAKITWCEPDFVYGFDENGEEVGIFYLSSGDMIDDDSFARYIYADRKFTVKGSDNYSVDCTFNEGWNILYEVYDDPEELLTTNKPSGKDFRWLFSE
jgi:hypothetical protein